MEDKALKLLLFEAFVTGYRAGCANDSDPMATFEEYWTALMADNVPFIN